MEEWREKTEELEAKLKEEREIHTDVMKTMDRWYLQRNQELTKENKQKDQKIKELEQQLKSLKLEAKSQTSPFQILTNWQNIHPSFTEDLVNQWKSSGFTYSQTQDWINIGLQPADYEFAHFLKNQKQKTPEEILNQENLENLKIECEQCQQNQTQTLQVQPANPPFGNN